MTRYELTDDDKDMLRICIQREIENLMNERTEGETYPLKPKALIERTIDFLGWDMEPTARKACETWITETCYANSTELEEYFSD